jgi:hypothetical protein
LKGCIAPVTHLVGEGRGNFSRLALKHLASIIDEALESGPVSLTITSGINPISLIN